MDELIKLFQVGGDIGIWVVVGIFWKFHTRLVVLEVKQDTIFHKLKELKL